MVECERTGEGIITYSYAHVLNLVTVGPADIEDTRGSDRAILWLSPNAGDRLVTR